ncbi:MAG: asparaginase [Firmicutes bacterium]|nr:asparaginase [Bacillota bacterium]
MLIEEYRGELLENTHDGRICVVDENGRVIAGVGDTNAFTYYRSVSKPFQFLPLIMRGLHEKYGLTTAETVVCAASHTGEDVHVRALESILKKTGFCEEQLIINPEFPANTAARNRLLANSLPKRKLYHNCAGKHLALMMLQKEITGSAEDYWKLESPAQQEVLRVVAEVSDFPSSEIICGIDGCGVPVFAVPLKGIAKAFVKLACPESAKNTKLSSALNVMADCIAQNPYIIRGHGYLCGEINTLPNIVAKGGAEGVYGFGLKRERIGVSLKIADGTEAVWPLIIAEILRQLDYKDDAAFKLLQNLRGPYKTNHNDTKIGSYRPVFRLANEIATK